MSKLLRALLLRFLTLGAGEESDEQTDLAATDVADPPTADDGESAEGTGDETLDDLIDVVEPGKDTKPGTDGDNAAVKEAQRRAQAAEDALAAERARQAPAPRAASAPDADYDREEALLKQAEARGDTPEQMSWLRWQVQLSRQARNTERTANQTLQEARDVADKAAFERLEATKPRTFKRYAARVEAALADMKAKGQPTLPRMAVLRFFIGDDIMNGTIKPKTARAVAAAGTTPTQVPRGRSPGNRSDVSGKGGGTSEHEKRRARLENQII